MEKTENRAFFFGEFEVDATRRLLRKRGQTVTLNPKAFDLLLVLVERRGEVLSKNDLLDAVWANQFVEEKNLTVHVAALRKILGETKKENRFIATVPGRGYSFVAEFDAPAENEFVIESQKFERVFFTEEIEEGTRHKAQSKTSERQFSYFYLLSFVFLLLLGGFLWQRRTGLSNGVPFAQTSIRQLTTNGKVSIAALSPDGKLFAYIVNDFGQKSLWLGYVGGGNHLLLRPAWADANYSELAFSPDSSRLYFSFQDEKNPNSALYRMPVSGGVEEKVSDSVDNFSLSPDGGQIAFAAHSANGAKDALFITATDGSEKREVASFQKAHFVSYDSVSWSADGKRLALSVIAEDDIYNQDILIVEIATGEIRRIKSDAWREIRKTAWLKDGSGLIVTGIEKTSFSSVIQHRIFHVEIPSGKTTEITTDLSSYESSLNLSAASDLLLSVEHRQLNNIWIAPTGDAGAARQITFGSFGRYDGLWGMDFTPDGKLVYTNSDTQSQLISVMNADGSEPRQLTAPGLIDSALNVTADGRYIVFLSNRGGGFNIWRMNVDGSIRTQLTFGKQNFQPFLSADGRWVYYKCWEKDTGELRRVSVDGGEPEIITDKETSWGGFSPDGKFFAASYKTDQSRLTVFNAATNEVVKQFDFPKGGTSSMGVHWSPDGKSIVYRDWNYGYWTQSVEGGEPQRMENLPKEKFYNFTFSKDGKQFAFVRGQETRDVVLISNIR